MITNVFYLLVFIVKSGSGTIDPRELKAAMQSLGFDSKNPTVSDASAT